MLIIFKVSVIAITVRFAWIYEYGDYMYDDDDDNSHLPTSEEISNKTPAPGQVQQLKPDQIYEYGDYDDDDDDDNSHLATSEEISNKTPAPGQVQQLKPVQPDQAL